VRRSKGVLDLESVNPELENGYSLEGTLSHSGPRDCAHGLYLTG
jgi:hypothetical protein